jgi:hypothetical protein
MHRLGNVLAVCTIVLSGCATGRYPSIATPYLSPFSGGTLAQYSAETGDNVSYWDGDEVAQQPSIKIDLVYQRAYFYNGDQLAGVSVVSTGREGYDTPFGEFRITHKDIDHASNLQGDYVDSSGHVVMRNVNIKLDPQPAGTTFRGAPNGSPIFPECGCRYSCRDHQKLTIHPDARKRERRSRRGDSSLL